MTVSGAITSAACNPTTDAPHASFVTVAFSATETSLGWQPRRALLTLRALAHFAAGNAPATIRTRTTVDRRMRDP